METAIIASHAEERQDSHPGYHDPTLSRRLGVHYALAVLIMTIYGIQVCPFIETLRLAELIPSLLGFMTLQYIARRYLHQQFVLNSPYKQQSPRIFIIEILLFIGSALLLTWFNTLAYGFPIGSGMKMLLGLVTLGFFTAIDMSLAWERQLFIYFSRSRRHLEVDRHYFPLTRKMSLVATASACFIVGIMFLVINKDLDWLATVGSTVSLHDARQAILGEVGFIAAVFLCYTLGIIRAFSLNLDTSFSSQNRTMALATRGIFDTVVPISSNDEFGEMAQYTNSMIAGLQHITEELKLTRDVTILSLATLAETRDNETGAHIIRTQNYVRVLAQYLANQDRFCDQLTADTIEMLYKCAPLHDIGKVGIPDHILLKPGKLTEAEFEIMKTHTTLGAEALHSAEQHLGESSFLSVAIQIAVSHHERWDGSGYPCGLSGNDIPLAGRLMALADVYDALISKRVYKAAMSHEQAKTLILEGRGTHFDPTVTDAFIATEQAFIEIAEEFRDADPDAFGAEHPGA